MDLVTWLTHSTSSAAGFSPIASSTALTTGSPTAHSHRPQASPSGGYDTQHWLQSAVPGPLLVPGPVPGPRCSR